MKNRQPLSDSSSKFMRFCLFLYVAADRFKVIFKKFAIQKTAHVNNSLQIDLTMAETFCSEIALTATTL